MVAISPAQAALPQSPEYGAKPRSRIIAGVLTVLVPGLGHLYAGRAKRAIWLFCIVSVLALTWLVGLRSAPPINMTAYLARLAFMLGVLAVYVYAIYDAVRGIDPRTAVPLRWFNRAVVYVGIIVINFASDQLSSYVVKSDSAASYSPGKVFNIPSGSMMPTLLVGDYVVAWSDYYKSHAPQRGDLVAFDYKPEANGEARQWIKRVVGLPGDRIQLRQGRLYINGALVPRTEVGPYTTSTAMGPAITFTHYVETPPGGPSYDIIKKTDDGSLDNTQVYAVPADHYFLLGDNRDNSIDSRVLRDIGYVRREAIHHKPMFIFWSRSWDRIGRPVQP